MFADIHYLCSLLKETDTEKRVDELVAGVRDCNITAIGGFPISNRHMGHLNGELWWCGFPVTGQRVCEEIIKGLGTSAVLTHMNPANKDLFSLGMMCADKRHTWAYNWITISVLFRGHGPETEMALSRDSRFFMSWPVGKTLGKVFIATGSLKSWIKFNSNKDSDDFPKDVKYSMLKASRLLSGICPG